MIITYANTRIKKICTDDASMHKALQKAGAKKLRLQLDLLLRSDNLEKVRLDIGHWHELKGGRYGQIAASLQEPLRLIIEPDYEFPPTKPDGGLDWNRIETVKIIEIVDYHD